MNKYIIKIYSNLNFVFYIQNNTYIPALAIFILLYPMWKLGTVY